YVLRKTVAGLGFQTFDPKFERAARRHEEPLPLVRFQLLRLREWRQLRGMQDLIRVRVSDPAQHARIGECPFQRVILGGKRRTKLVQIRMEDLNSSRVHGAQSWVAAQNMKRSPALGSRFGKHKRTVGKIES